MTETLPTPLLSSLSDLLVTQMGLYFPANRRADLERGLRAAAAAFGFTEAEACAEWLLSSPALTREQIETLASQLTVGETYFFRERLAFQALETHVLPELIRSRDAARKLRIWSAGCATGEEPYSLAILIAQMIPNLSEWNISILGTDINPQSLQRAVAGVYTPWSFRECSGVMAEAYFKKNDERSFRISPAIRNMVDFSYLNLVDDRYPSLPNDTGSFDLIFCRNVLMYFSSEQAKRVISRLHRCLLEGSWLVVSSAEASHVLFSEFTTVNFPGAILYRKDRQAPQESVGALISSMEMSFSPAPAAPEDRVDFVLPEPPDPLAGREHAASPAAERLSAPMPAIPSETPVDATGEGGLPPRAGDPFAEYGEGHYAEAQRLVAALLMAQPENARAMALQARLLANQGQLADALAWCDKAIATEKLEPRFHYLRATILQESGQLSEGADALKRVLYLDHHFVLGHFALGNIQRSLGRTRDAEKQFRNVLRLLEDYRPEETLPESEGITAGRLKAIVDLRFSTGDGDLAPG